MKKVIRYKCQFCNKLASRPETIERHEIECMKNPSGKNCYKCKHAVRGGYKDDRFGDSFYDKEIPYCYLHEIPLQEIRSCGQDAKTCEDYEENGLYSDRKMNEAGRIADCFGEEIKL